MLEGDEEGAKFKMSDAMPAALDMHTQQLLRIFSTRMYVLHTHV